MSSRPRRPAACAGAEVSLGPGPLAVNDRLKLSGEIIAAAVLEAGRFYRRPTGGVHDSGFLESLAHGLFVPRTVTNVPRTTEFTEKDSQNRFWAPWS